MAVLPLFAVCAPLSSHELHIPNSKVARVASAIQKKVASYPAPVTLKRSQAGSDDRERFPNFFKFVPTGTPTTADSQPPIVCESPAGSPASLAAGKQATQARPGFCVLVGVV
jgi:hypothetical protein